MGRHHINAAALVMGIVALAILVVSKRLVPKFPMAVVLMVTGALFTYFGPVKEWGVPTLSAVEPGMPRWYIPDFEAVFSVQKARGNSFKSFGCCCHHGRDTSGRKQFRTEKRIQNR